MGMLKLASLMVIIPISLLLTASFFVLFALRKVEEKWLKAFGYVVAGFLCLSAIVVLLGVAFNANRDPSRMKYMMQQKMKALHHPQMMQGNMPEKTMPEKGAPVKN